MKERELSFNTNMDPTIEVLEESTKEKIKKEINNFQLALFEIDRGVNDNKLETGYKETLLSCLEHNITSLMKLLNYDTTLEREKKERYERIRELNNENRELRSQLGEKVSNEDVREKLKNIIKKVREWWDEEGFGHVAEAKFNEYGTLELKLSGYISDIGYKKDASERVANLKSKGFLIYSETGDFRVIDNDSNKILLKQLVKAKFPSGEVSEYNSRESRKRGISIFSDIHVTISDLNDIK